ncbi:MAG: Bcr/CflA family efflux MFS transporter [Rubrivivax sp.]
MTARRGPVLALLLLQIAYGLLAMTLCLPSMPDWATLFGATPAQVQLSFGGYLVAFGLAQLVHGPLSDRVGRRPVLLAGAAAAALGSLAAAAAPTLAALVAARVLQGAGAAAGMVVGRALVHDHFQGPDRTRAMAWVGMAMGLCPPLATIVGGQLHVQLGWRANFVVLAAVALALAAVTWRVLPARAASPAARGAASASWRGMLQGYRTLLRERAFGWHVAVLGGTTGTFYVFLAGAPLVLAPMGVGADRVGFFIAFVPLSYIAGNALTTRLARRFGDLAIMRGGQLLNLISLTLLVGLALAGWRHPLAFSAPLVLMGIGHGLLLPPTLARTVGMHAALAGAAAAVAGLMQQLAGALGAYAVGLLRHDHVAPLGLLMLAITAGAGWALHRATGRAAAMPAPQMRP